jgi:hypothetical protein
LNTDILGNLTQFKALVATTEQDYFAHLVHTHLAARQQNAGDDCTKLEQQVYPMLKLRLARREEFMKKEI